MRQYHTYEMVWGQVEESLTTCCLCDVYTFTGVLLTRLRYIITPTDVRSEIVAGCTIHIDSYY